MFISAFVYYVLQRARAVDGVFSNNIHPHMECGTAKTLELFFVSDTLLHGADRAVRWVDPFGAGLYTLQEKGRRITENIRVEVDGGGAVVFKWSVEHGSSIIHGLETSSAAPLTSIPPLEPLQSV